MKTVKECPVCDNEAKLISEIAEHEFRKEKFRVREFFYRCGNCGEEFTTTRTDELTINQVYNQYREKYGLPFPEELIRIREKYKLSAQKMSQVLGFGINTYSNYEQGEIPAMANARLIRSAENPETFLSYLMQSKESFSEDRFLQLEKEVRRLVQDKSMVEEPCAFNWYSTPCQYTGYVLPSLEKIINLILIYLTDCRPDYNDRLKINKLLFYTDFSHYQEFGKSITGLTYRAVPYGPAPAKYDSLFAMIIEKEEFLELNLFKSGNSQVVERYRAVRSPDLALFSSDERETIGRIIQEFENERSWDMVELSHKERAWIELHEQRKLVSYQEYAFDIVGIRE